MKLHLHTDKTLQLVRAYTEQQITVGDTVYRASLIITPDRVIPDWPPTGATCLGEQDFVRLGDLDPEVLLLGTGRRLLFPPRRITRPLMDRSIGLEVMDTAAACRTYNILATEGRKVVAALIVEK